MGVLSSKLFTSRLGVVGVLLGSLAFGYPAHSQMGANGTDGATGGTGMPGKDGTAGANSIGGTSGLTVTGGFGGAGGKGGTAAVRASGKDGGDGGKGGAAQADVIANGASAVAVGGRPGSGVSGSASYRPNSALFGNLVGGDGGNAGVAGNASDNGDAIATATSPAGGAMARATADGNAPTASLRGTAGVGGMGGAGGVQGGNGGNGAKGGNATATATARGAGGEASASAAAGDGGFGGNGGPAQPMDSLVGQKIVGGKGGNGANGGNAIAKATAMNGPIALATATGGAGGNAGDGGPGITKKGAFGSAGDGGTADATASATNLTGNALAVSQASGGNGGLSQPGTKITARATPGNAMATATANAPKGDATADPTAINGLGNGGTATAIGMATGKGGAATPQARTATSSTRLKTSINNRANSPIPVGGAGNVNAEAVVGNAAPLPALKPNTTLNSFVAAVGDPLLSDVIATSAGKPNVITGLGIDTGAGDQLGLLEMGGLYPDVAPGASATFSASSMFSFDPDQIPKDNFRVGLQDAQWTGAGFDKLQFQITSDGALVLSETFTSLTSAVAFFTDDVIDIGSIAPDASGLLDLGFNFELTAHTPGEGFASDLAVASVVPEPPSQLLLLVGFAALLGLVVRRGSLMAAAGLAGSS